MESTKKYEYILEQSEILEFCLHALAESAKRKKWTWLRLILILALEWLILPRAAVWIAVLLVEDGSLDTVTNISEDDSKVDWERGKGTITVSLEWEGQTYHWDMRVYYDWLDSDVLGILNALLTEQKSQKLFYAAGDNGQGAIIFFCTAEWAENFMEATGLELTYCTTWSTEQMKNAQ